MMKQTLGQHIAEKRRGRGMTQQALAEQLNVTLQRGRDAVQPAHGAGEAGHGGAHL